MIEIIRFGSQATIVDNGRYHYRRYGVPISGAMDRNSAARANSLLSNVPDAAVIELYQPGHELLFHCSTFVALAGAEAEIFLGDKRIYSDGVYKIKKNTRLSIGKMTRGCRIYLAVSGGVKSKKVLESRSPIPGFLNRHLYKGDRIPISPVQHSINVSSSIAAINLELTASVPCYSGPEWNLFSSKSQNKMLSMDYVIDQKSDRMGYRLKGDPIASEIEIYSSPVMPGTVQLISLGLPLILMRECQTTGGYPRILQLTEESINQIAQRRPGDSVRFELIS